MKPELLALCTDDIRREAADAFGLDPSTLRSLDGFENVVLAASRNGQLHILRLSHDTHRTPEHIHAELHWIEYLASHGVSVCTPLRSRSDRLTEIFASDSGQFVAAAFEKAPGVQVRRDERTPEMARNRGRLLGRMHFLTKEYEPPSETVRRYPWWEEHDFTHYSRYLPVEDGIIAERFAELQEQLCAIPFDNDSFGLIHMDAHGGNLFFDGDKPTLFDFDDCAYDFFVSDIAISLFYELLLQPPERDVRALACDFLYTFLEGYRTEHSLDNKWLEIIPRILKRREMVLYVALFRGFDPDNFDDWCQRYISEKRPCIVDRTPVVDLDWSQFDLGGR